MRVNIGRPTRRIHYSDVRTPLENALHITDERSVGLMKDSRPKLCWGLNHSVQSNSEQDVEGFLYAKYRII